MESTQRRVSHAALASGPAIGEVTVAFESPAYFSRNRTDVLVPEPRLIAGSWRRRWNASLPDADALVITDEAWRDAHPLIELAAFDLRTEAMGSGYGRPRAGFVGSVTLRAARGAPAAVQGMLGTLARFAEYSGTGAQVTHGFGATTLTGSRC
jgi:CRISPR-associated endoribonuclease Cas6